MSNAPRRRRRRNAQLGSVPRAVRLGAAALGAAEATAAVAGLVVPGAAQAAAVPVPPVAPVNVPAAAAADAGRSSIPAPPVVPAAAPGADSAPDAAVVESAAAAVERTTLGQPQAPPADAGSSGTAYTVSNGGSAWLKAQEDCAAVLRQGNRCDVRATAEAYKAAHDTKHGDVWRPGQEVVLPAPVLKPPCGHQRDGGYVICPGDTAMDLASQLAPTLPAVDRYWVARRMIDAAGGMFNPDDRLGDIQSRPVTVGDTPGGRRFEAGANPVHGLTSTVRDLWAKGGGDPTDEAGVRAFAASVGITSPDTHLALGFGITVPDPTSRFVRTPEGVAVEPQADAFGNRATWEATCAAIGAADCGKLRGWLADTAGVAIGDGQIPATGFSIPNWVLAGRGGPYEYGDWGTGGTASGGGGSTGGPDDPAVIKPIGAGDVIPPLTARPGETWDLATEIKPYLIFCGLYQGVGAVLGDFSPNNCISGLVEIAARKSTGTAVRTVIGDVPVGSLGDTLVNAGGRIGGDWWFTKYLDQPKFRFWRRAFQSVLEALEPNPSVFKTNEEVLADYAISFGVEAGPDVWILWPLTKQISWLKGWHVGLISVAIGAVKVTLSDVLPWMHGEKRFESVDHNLMVIPSVLNIYKDENGTPWLAPFGPGIDGKKVEAWTEVGDGKCAERASADQWTWNDVDPASLDCGPTIWAPSVNANHPDYVPGNGGCAGGSWPHGLRITEDILIQTGCKAISAWSQMDGPPPTWSPEYQTLADNCNKLVDASPTKVDDEQHTRGKVCLDVMYTEPILPDHPEYENAEPIDYTPELGVIATHLQARCAPGYWRQSKGELLPSMFDCKALWALGDGDDWPDVPLDRRD